MNAMMVWSFTNCHILSHFDLELVPAPGLLLYECLNKKMLGPTVLVQLHIFDVDASMPVFLCGNPFFSVSDPTEVKAAGGKVLDFEGQLKVGVRGKLNHTQEPCWLLQGFILCYTMFIHSYTTVYLVCPCFLIICLS